MHKTRTARKTHQGDCRDGASFRNIMTPRQSGGPPTGILWVRGCEERPYGSEFPAVRLSETG